MNQRQMLTPRVLASKRFAAGVRASAALLLAVFVVVAMPMEERQLGLLGMAYAGAGRDFGRANIALAPSILGLLAVRSLQKGWL